MNCQQVQHWLLECDDARSSSCASPSVAAHLEQCAACRRLANQVAALEAAWRELPLPPGAEQAKAAFLARLPEVTREELAPDTCHLPVFAAMSPNDDLTSFLHPAEPAATFGSVNRRRWLQYSGAAVATLLAVGTGAWLLLAGGEAEADDDLLDRLLDWNLEIADTASPDDRQRLYAEAEQLRAAMGTTRLSPEQAALAESYLENGAWLASHQDPVFAADHFDGLAERLLELAHQAGAKGNHKRMKRFLQQHNRVLEAGVNPNIAAAEALRTLDLEHQKRLEKLTIEDSYRLQQLTSLFDHTPDASRAEIRRALSLHAKRTKNKKGGKGKKSPGAN